MVKWTPALLLVVGCLSGDNVIPETENQEPPPPQIEIVNCRIQLADTVIDANPLKVVSAHEFGVRRVTDLDGITFVRSPQIRALGIDPTAVQNVGSLQVRTFELDNLHPGEFEIEVTDPACELQDVATFFIP